MNPNVIETQHLTRYYGNHCVVNDLNLQVRRGSVFGFLGRNGAGKTTTIRMLLGLVPPTRGSIRILDYDATHLPPEARARIGYLAEGHFVYGWMTVKEAGKFQSSFYGKRWNHDLYHAVIKHFGLRPQAKCSHLSRGQRAGLCLAMTLAQEPELLILDDPALGLDPVARLSLLEAMIYVTRRADRTILFSSHLLTDVERVADEIAVMDQGVLRAHCSIETFRQKVQQYVLKFAGDPPENAVVPGLLNSLRREKELVITLVGAGQETLESLERLDPLSIDRVPLTMEESFVGYVSDRGEKSFFFKSMENLP